MRVFKLVSALAVVLALTAIAATSALAAVEFLPGTAGTTFTGSSKEAKLVSAAGTIVCKKSVTSAGELTSKTEGTATIVFEECSIAGLEARGLGDAASSKKITTNVKMKACTVSTSPLVGAVAITPSPVHIEVPAAKLLLLVEGTVIGLLTPVNSKTKEFGLVLNEKEKKQEDRVCDGKTQTLIVKDDGTETGEGVEIVKEGKIVFKVEEEFMT